MICKSMVKITPMEKIDSSFFGVIFTLFWWRCIGINPYWRFLFLSVSSGQPFLWQKHAWLQERRKMPTTHSTGEWSMLRICLARPCGREFSSPGRSSWLQPWSWTSTTTCTSPRQSQTLQVTRQIAQALTSVWLGMLESGSVTDQKYFYLILRFRLSAR